MVGGPGSMAPPLRGLSSMFSSIDGGHSRISGTTSQGSHRRRFLVLIVDSLGSPALPPKGPTIDVLKN
jgi:hypothetical protein